MAEADPGHLPVVVVSCEHGGREVPDRWAPIFQGAEAVLGSHRGWDPGARAMAEVLGARLCVEPLVATVTRLLVDLNRSPSNRSVFSEFTRGLTTEERSALLRDHHAPHRERVRRALERKLRGVEREVHGVEREVRGVEREVRGVGRERRAASRQSRLHPGTPGAVLHLAVHSFTPVLDGSARTTDLALLYDPARPRERALADAWTAGLKRRFPGRRIHRNRPYRGASDGLPTWLRRELGAGYLGIEIEVGQAWLAGEGAADEVGAALADTLLKAYSAA